MVGTLSEGNRRNGHWPDMLALVVRQYDHKQIVGHSFLARSNRYIAPGAGTVVMFLGLNLDAPSCKNSVIACCTARRLFHPEDFLSIDLTNGSRDCAIVVAEGRKPSANLHDLQ